MWPVDCRRWKDPQHGRIKTLNIHRDISDVPDLKYPLQPSTWRNRGSLKASLRKLRVGVSKYLQPTLHDAVDR